MKKLLSILSIVTLLLVASCQKETVAPTRSTSDVPSWKAAPSRTASPTSGTTGGGVVAPTGSGVITPTTGTVSTTGTEGSITDPNPEPDIIRKKGK